MASFWTTDVIPVASAATAAISAGAAVVAAWLARETVKETREMRADAKKAADDATAHAKTQLAEQQRLAAEELTNLQRLSDAELADRRKLADAEAADRRSFADDEARAQRLVQLERVSDLLLDIIEVARSESRQKPEPIAPGHTGSRLPAMLKRLENAVAVLARLDTIYPKATGELATRGYGAGSNVLGILRDALNAMDEIQAITLSIGIGHAGPPSIAPPL